MIIKVLKTNVREQKREWKPGMFTNPSHLIYEAPGLLDQLNAMVEWKFVEWPKIKNENEEEVEQKDYLGVDPKLEPGDAFSIGGGGNLQIFRVIDSDRIGLEHTETGGLAMERFKKEILLPEIKYLYNHTISAGQLTIEALDYVPDEFTLEKRVTSSVWKIFSDRFFPGRQDIIPGGKIIKASFEVDYSIMPIECCIYNKSFKFKPDDVMDEPDFLETLVEDLMAAFYNKYPRLQIETNQDKELEDINKALEKMIGK